jgi:hypothetical protein
MTKEVFKSKFALATFNEQTKTYILKYYPETGNMTNEEWKTLMRDLLKITEKYKPQYIIDDNSERLYAYPPEIQAWTLELFIDSWNRNGLKKYVQILPKDFIGELSGEQIVEMANMKFSEIFDNTFVEDYESAIKWIAESN